MQANFVIKAKDFTPDYADGLSRLFKDSVLTIKITYGSEVAATETRSSTFSERKGKKRGPKPNFRDVDNTPKPHRKRGRKPKVVLENADSSSLQ